MKIVSIHVGQPQTLIYKGKNVFTAFVKAPVEGTVRVHWHGLEGDGQADKAVHGGTDKAVYAFGLDAYAQWRKEKPEHRYENGAFGENLCIDTLDENNVFVGDVFAVGGAELQAVEHRQPCHKLNAKFQDEMMVKRFMAFKRSGVYFRVLKEGEIAAGDSFHLIHRERALLSIAELASLGKEMRMPKERALELLSIESLTAKQRVKLQKLVDS